ncbi:MAG TPA: hypothetical protein DEG26_04275, partial [Chloroflexi bacterium]|nr:hypothetical protein [Chloroflexota bacterium]
MRGYEPARSPRAPRASRASAAHKVTSPVPETVPLTLPAMGESVTEGTVVNWVKKAGDPVTEGETLVEVTTDKVDVEVPSPVSGTLTEITAPEGETVPVGATLGLIAPGPGATPGPSAEGTI